LAEGVGWVEVFVFQPPPKFYGILICHQPVAKQVQNLISGEMHQGQKHASHLFYFYQKNALFFTSF